MTEKMTNKYFKLKATDFYFKIGRCVHDQSSASIIFEILDYSGYLKHIPDTLRIDNDIYVKLGYSFESRIEEITQDQFYQNLADRITRFIIRMNFDKDLSPFELDFNATEERRALYRKIKIPLIIKEVIE